MATLTNIVVKACWIGVSIIGGGVLLSCVATLAFAIVHMN